MTEWEVLIGMMVGVAITGSAMFASWLIYEAFEEMRRFIISRKNQAGRIEIGKR